MIKAIFDGYSVITVYGLTQYDYGQILEISGIEIPDGTEIHFCQGGKAITQYIRANQVLIPDHMLQYSAAINAYLYKADHKSGETIKRIILSISPREKPGDYVTPEEPAYSRLLPVGGEDGQYISIKNGEYVWVNADDEFATDKELAAVAATVPQFATMKEIEDFLYKED